MKRDHSRTLTLLSRISSMAIGSPSTFCKAALVNSYASGGILLFDACEKLVYLAVCYTTLEPYKKISSDNCKAIKIITRQSFHTLWLTRITVNFPERPLLPYLMSQKLRQVCSLEVTISLLSVAVWPAGHKHTRHTGGTMPAWDTNSIQLEKPGQYCSHLLVHVIIQ